MGLGTDDDDLAPVIRMDIVRNKGIELWECCRGKNYKEYRRSSRMLVELVQEHVVLR